MKGIELLTVNDLHCRKGERELYTDIGFSLRASDCLHIKGANGSGKTTLLRQLAGLTESHVGSVNWQSTSAQARPFSYLGHLDGHKPELTAWENLYFYAQYYADASESKTQLGDLIDQTLFDLGILKCADLKTGHLSFGQKRRLSLARVLISRATTWLLDEPLTGIDTAGRELFLHAFQAQLAEGAIILTHHQSLSDASFAAQIRELNLTP